MIGMTGKVCVTLGLACVTRVTGLLLSLVLVLPAQAGVSLPRPQVETLPNGLELHFYPSDRIPIVDVVLVSRAGFREDPPGKSGSAEMLSSLVDRGAGGMSARDLNQRIESIGASRVISLDADYSTLGLHALSPEAPALVELVAKMAISPTLEPVEFARERARVVERWKKFGEQGDALADLALHRLIFQGTPYARSNVDSAAELMKLSAVDVAEFHRKNYDPKSSVLVVIGKYDATKVREAISRFFGQWTSPTLVAPAKAALSRRVTDSKRRPKVKPGDILVVERKGLPQVSVRLGRLAESVLSPDTPALVVANTILGEHYMSRLASIIRDELGLAYYAESSLEFSRDATRFQVRSATQAEASGKLIDKLQEILRQTRTNELSASEVEQAKSYLKGSLARAISTPALVASRRIADRYIGLPMDRLDRVSEEIASAQLARVRKAAQSTFGTGQHYIVLVGDADEISRSLSPAQKKRMVRIKPEALQ